MRRTAALALLGLLFGCTRLLPGGSNPEPVAEAEPRAAVSVEVWSGLRAGRAIPAPATPHVELVVDLSRSMRTAPGDAPLHLYGAREAAARFVEALPDETTLAVHVVGVSKRRPCAEATRVASGRVDPLRETLAGRLRRLWPGGEGSLAETLARIARRRGDDEPEARVVAFSDLDPACGGDLCAAAAELVASQARLELVLFGAAPAPACLDDLVAPEAPWLAQREAPEPASFQVLDPESGDVLQRGRADGVPVVLRAGRGLLRVETDPPAELGPLTFEATTHSRVRLLDFLALRPPEREWRWKILPMSPSTPDATDAGDPEPRPE